MVLRTLQCAAADEEPGRGAAGTSRALGGRSTLIPESIRLPQSVEMLLDRF
jgi:hypothetical protein